MSASTPHITSLLQDFIDGELQADQQASVRGHLAHCASCRQELEQLESLVSGLQKLPNALPPERNLWPEIEQEIQYQKAVTNRRAFSVRRPMRRVGKKGWNANWQSTAAILFIVVLGIILSITLRTSWEVSTLAGIPTIAGEALGQKGNLKKGSWLETPEASRAELKVGTIGSVELEPASRLQLLSMSRDDHRLHLERGRLHAKIWAPPRLFFVETPAGTAIDLGCEYTLDVDSMGNSLLHVQSGFVSFAAGSREVVVPAGWIVQARPGHFTGTPYSETASPAFRDALAQFDFEGGGSGAIDDVLTIARTEDALTLWGLLWHAPAAERPRIYDKLAALTLPRAHTTRAGVLSKDPEMIDRWRRHLNIDLSLWLDDKKKLRKRLLGQSDEAA